MGLENLAHSFGVAEIRNAEFLPPCSTAFSQLLLKVVNAGLILVETQQQAMFLSFFVIMIYLLMSGLLTPIDSMPHWVQLASLLNPVRHFVSIARAILVKGAGLRDIAMPLATLGGFAVAFLSLAIRQYHKRAA